jgi:DNA integrity scanning protein DisA with diadenylate cyclase activity
MATAKMPCAILPTELHFVPEEQRSQEVPLIRASCAAEERTVHPVMLPKGSLTASLTRISMTLTQQNQSAVYEGLDKSYYIAPVVLRGEKIGTLIAVGPHNPGDTQALLERLVRKGRKHSVCVKS